MNPIRKIIIMGVSGSGKTTIGRLLSDKTSIPFFDADHFHPQANLLKMESGIPLTDEDRLPWLTTLQELINKESQLILACSALRQQYRQMLDPDNQCLWVYLKGDQATIAKRMQARKHFMPPTLLDSQFETLEVPTQALTLNILESPEKLVHQIQLKLAPK